MKPTKGLLPAAPLRAAVLPAILVLFGFAAGCASPPPPAEQPPPAVAEPVQPLPSPPEPAPVDEHRWLSRIFITDPGTPHQGEMGYLFYNDELVEGWFDAMQVGQQRYLFHDRMRTWQAGGYLPDAKYRPKHPAVAGAVADGELRQGWYASDPLQRKDGTPDFWIHVSRGTLAAWLDPRQMTAFADSHGIRPITRVEPIDLHGQAVEKKE